MKSLNRIAKECVLNGVIVRLIPDSIGFWVGRSHDRMVSGLPVLVIANSSYHLGSHRFMKTGDRHCGVFGRANYFYSHHPPSGLVDPVGIERTRIDSAETGWT